MNRLSIDGSLVHAGLIAACVVAGIIYFGVALTAELLLAWTVLTAWPVLKRGLPRLPGSLTVWACAWLICLGAIAWHTEVPYTSWFYFWTLAGLPLSILVWQLQSDPDRVWAWLRQGCGWGRPCSPVGELRRWQAVRNAGAWPLVDPNAYAGAINLFWFALAARFLSVDTRGTATLDRGLDDGDFHAAVDGVLRRGLKGRDAVLGCSVFRSCFGSREAPRASGAGRCFCLPAESRALAWWCSCPPASLSAIRPRRSAARTNLSTRAC